MDPSWVIFFIFFKGLFGLSWSIGLSIDIYRHLSWPENKFRRPWPSIRWIRGWWAGLGCAAKGGVIIAGQGCPGSKEAIKVKVGLGALETSGFSVAPWGPWENHGWTMFSYGLTMVNYQEIGSGLGMVVVIGSLFTAKPGGDFTVGDRTGK